MRVMLIAHMSTEVSNAGVRDGRMGELLQRTMQ